MGRGSGLAGYPCKMTVLGSIPNDSTISNARLAHVGRGNTLRTCLGSVRHRHRVPIRYRKLYQMTSLMRYSASNFNKSGYPLMEGAARGANKS